MIAMLRRAIAPAAVMLAAAVCAHAQQLPPPQSQQAPEAPQAGQAPQGNPVCTRLEGQLAAFDRGAADNVRAEQIRKYEEAAAGQQSELDRQQAQARRLNCESNSFFVLFSGGQNPQCGPLNSKISQMRGNLDRINADLDRLRGNSAAPEREGQRRAILVALAQNNCGAQYRAAVASAPPQRSGSLFESLFGPGPGSILAPSGGGGFMGGSDTYRTVCVRTCDGFFYPISFSTNASRFGEDENDLPEVLSRGRGDAVLAPQPGRGHQPGGVNHRQPALHVVAERLQIPAGLGQQLQLPQARRELGTDHEERRRHHRRAGRHRRQRSACPAIVAAALRRAGPADPGRACRGHRSDPAGAEAGVGFRCAGAGSALACRSASGNRTARHGRAAGRKPEPVKPDPNRNIRAVGPTFLPAR